MYYAGGAIYGVWDANIILIGVHFGDNIGWHGKLGNKGNVFVQRKPSDTIKPSREEYRSSFIPTFKTKFFMMNAPDDLSSRAFGITRSLGQWTTDVATNKYLSPDDVWLPLNPISTYGLNSLNYCDDLAFASCRTFMGRSQCFKDKYPNEAAIISGGMAGSVQPTYCAGTCVGGWYGKTVAAATPEDGKIEMCGETRLRGEYCGSQRCPDVIQPCRMCPKGYHTIKNEGNEECDKCPSTYYNDQVGSSECKLCPGGAVSIEGSTDPSDCGVCPAGRYTCGTEIGNCDEGKSAKDCTICAAGRYNTEGTRNECDACPKNTFLQDPATKHENHDSADDCKPCEDSQPDTFSVPGSQYCK